MDKFIKDNHLSFGEGRRNSTIVVLIGYSQHLGLTKSEFRGELEQEIKEDKFIGEEIDRLWGYCEKNKYKKYWKTADAKSKYKF